MKDIRIEKPCVFCGKVHAVEIYAYEWNRWEDGLCIQDAMPEETAEVREFLISGICPACQTAIFGEDEEEEGNPLDEPFVEFDIDEDWWPF